MRSIAVTIALIVTAVSSSPLVAQRKDCQDTKTPEHLPPVSAVVDSARALTELATISAPAGMLFSLVFQDGDSLPLVRPLYDTDRTAAAIIAGLVRPQRPAHLWGIRVRVAQGPPSFLTLERAVYCPPAVVDGSLNGMRIVSIQVQPGDRGMSSPRGHVTVRLAVRVSDDGVPLAVNITASTGFQEFDEQILQQWRALRFHPALLDGLPVEAMYKTDGQSPRL